MGPVLVRYGFSGDKRGSAELRWAGLMKTQWIWRCWSKSRTHTQILVLLWHGNILVVIFWVWINFWVEVFLVKALSNSSHNHATVGSYPKLQGKFPLHRETEVNLLNARAVIADLANHNKDIRSMNMDIQKLGVLKLKKVRHGRSFERFHNQLSFRSLRLVISLFPDLKSDQANRLMNILDLMEPVWLNSWWMQQGPYLLFRCTRPWSMIPTSDRKTPHFCLQAEAAQRAASASTAVSATEVKWCCSKTAGIAIWTNLEELSQ